MKFTRVVLQLIIRKPFEKLSGESSNGELIYSIVFPISYTRCYHPHSWKIQLFCLSGGFFTNIHDSQDSRERGKGVYLTSLYNFHLPEKRLGISRVITAGSSHLHIASSRTRTGTSLVSKRKSLTTKLRVYFGSTASFITENKSLKRMLDKLDPTTEPLVIPNITSSHEL